MSSSASSGPQVKLISSDDISFKVPLGAVIPSTVLYNICHDLNPSNTDPDFEIPLPIVNSDALNVVVKWLMHHHQENPEWSQQGPFEWKYHSILARGSSWDTMLLEENRDSIFDLIFVADYLNLPSLHIVCKDFVQNLLHEASPNEVAQVLNQF